MSVSDEREILFSAKVSPQLQDTPRYSLDLFTGPRRKIAVAISDLWEEEHGEIDDGKLSARCGLSLASLFAEQEGCYRLSSAAFQLKVNGLLRARKNGELIKLLDQEKRTELKTGTQDEKALGRIRELVREIDEFENPVTSLKPLSAVESKAISWLWSGRIPLGMLSLLAGSAGGGKSTLAHAITARLSRGEPLPDSTGAVLDCDSIILAAEDPIAQAVRPRAEVNGADLARIFFIEAEDLDVGEIFGPLQQALTQNPRIKFVVVDPLNAFLKAGTDYFRDPDVRRALLRPLAAIAEKTGAAVLGICHLNKRTDESGALNRIGGSVAYGATPRSVLALGIDPDNPERRLLAPAKCNYAKMPGTIAFTIGDGGRVEFEPNIINIGADEILQRRDPGQAAEGDFAAEWLIGQLKGGPVELQNLLQAAKKESISRPCLFRVRKKIGVISRVSGYGQFKTSSWELPK